MSESTELNDDANALCYHQEELFAGVSVSCFKTSLNGIEVIRIETCRIAGRNC